MKKQMKKILALILSVSMLLSIAPVSTLAANGNTSISTATDISNGEAYIDKLANVSTSSYYYYVYKAPASGYVSFTLSRADYSSSDRTAWSLYLFDSNMNEMDYSTYIYDSYTTYTQLVQAGSTYYLRVRGQYSNASEIPFSLQANYTKFSYVEKEPNNNHSLATKLVAGKKYLGILSSSKDTDFYKITANKSGYYTISLDRYDYSTTVSPNWDFTLYDSNMNRLYSICSTYENDTTNTHNLKLALAKGKSVYIAISDYSKADNQLYSISTTFKATSNIETEPNNDFSPADKLNIGTTYYGSMAEEKTSDYFCFTAKSTAKYKVSLSLSKEVPFGYKIYIYDSSKKELSHSSKTIYKSGYLTFSTKKGKKYYVVIKHATPSQGKSVGALYKIKVAKK